MADTSTLSNRYAHEVDTIEWILENAVDNAANCKDVAGTFYASLKAAIETHCTDEGIARAARIHVAAETYKQAAFALREATIALQETLKDGSAVRIYVATNEAIRLRGEWKLAESALYELVSN